MHNCFLFNLLWTIVSLLAFVSSEVALEKPTSSVEPLFRFPFIKHLANPCRITLEGAITFANKKSSTGQPFPLRLLSTDGTPLSQQVSDYLEPFREFYTSPSPFSSVLERQANIESMNVVLQQAKFHIKGVYPSPALVFCDNMQLQSIPSTKIDSSQRSDIAAEELYGHLAVALAHLHLMTRDMAESPRCYPLEGRSHRQNVRKLAEKVEELMCLLVPYGMSWNKDEGDSITTNFLQVINKVLQTQVNRFFNCSAREIRGCVVHRYTKHTLEQVQQFITKKHNQ